MFYLQFVGTDSNTCEFTATFVGKRVIKADELHESNCFDVTDDVGELYLRYKRSNYDYRNVFRDFCLNDLDI